MLDTIHHLVAGVDLSPLTDSLMTITDKDVDIIGSFQKWFSNFIKSGQVWALIVGIVAGYLFKGMTSY
ncbi:hypothetical protein V0288_08035 [Pannus brasiliensis CCIBt3594]|uniref:Uncharacterized protein n=1 Tax=Pannus brasiliensis CCIBt3594 TaxID=1427578 RepID=A0AAW9QPC5_9CHRO